MSRKSSTDKELSSEAWAAAAGAYTDLMTARILHKVPVNVVESITGVRLT
jgi:hypothetical protein